MLSFTFIARPADTSALYREVGGAYVVVLIDDPRREVAEAAARGLVGESGWEIESLDDWGAVRASALASDAAEAALHREAVEHGRSIVFHTWPINEDVTG